MCFTPIHSWLYATRISWSTSPCLSWALTFNEQVLMFTQRVMSEYTIWFFVFLIVTATWAVMSLMIAAMLARFKAVSFAENLRLKKERMKVGWLVSTLC